ncbi:hypothetical protein D1007_38501 [Hordeum vulgare]|nr:hypothetical protein D1007_43592 [Hordeum vulgare]KAE8787564.1 hypothetical protein D1007_38501 [Hordeum vulgare]
MFVSCAIRHIFEEDIHRIEPDVMQGDINSWTAYFFTFERLQYERIPKKVVQRIEKKTGILEEEGQLMLFHDVDAYVDARYKKLTDERLVLQGGFRTYAHLLGLKIDDLVSNFFEKVEDPAAIKVWFTVIS